MESVRVRGIIYYYNVLNVTAQSRQVFHIEIALVLGTVLAVKARVYDRTLWIEHLEQGLGIS